MMAKTWGHLTAFPISHFLPYRSSSRNTLTKQTRKLLAHCSKPAFEDARGFSLPAWLAGTINSDSTHEPKAVPCGPARSDHLDSFWSTRGPYTTAFLGHWYPPRSQDTATLAVTLGTPPPTCGWTRSSHTRASRPHACIFSHAKATRHTHCRNKSTKQKGRGQKGMQRATNTDLQPLPHPHLKHSRKASKEQTFCQIKYCVSGCSVPQTHRLSDGVGCSGGTLLQHQMLHPEPLVWSTRAEVTSLHSWGLPWTTVQPIEEHKSYRDIIKRKTLSEAMGS